MSASLPKLPNGSYLYVLGEASTREGFKVPHSFKNNLNKPYVNLEKIPEFKEGDIMFSPSHGWGKISLTGIGIYPIKLVGLNESMTSFTTTGKIIKSALYRTLFTVEETKLLFNLEPPKEKDELDIMLEKAIEFYGTDTLKAGAKLLPTGGYYSKVTENIVFTKKEKFIYRDDNLFYIVSPIQYLLFNVDGKFRPIILGYSNDREPKPLVKGMDCFYVDANGEGFLAQILDTPLTGELKLFTSIEDAGEYAKNLRKVQVEITEAEYEMIKKQRNDSKTL